MRPRSKSETQWLVEAAAQKWIDQRSVTPILFIWQVLPAKKLDKGPYKLTLADKV
jgi:hypothetical protein